MSDFTDDEEMREAATSLFCKHGLWPHEGCVKCKHDAPPQPPTCLPLCGQPTSATFSHASGCPNAPQPPFTITNQHDAAPVTEERCPPHLWTWRQLPPSKFEEALAALEEFMRTRIYHEEADLERVKVEAVRAAHAEATDAAYERGRKDAADVWFKAETRRTAEAHTAGVAKGRLGLAAAVLRAEAKGYAAEGNETVANHLRRCADRLAARAGEEPTRG